MGLLPFGCCQHSLVSGHINLYFKASIFKSLCPVLMWSSHEYMGAGTEYVYVCMPADMCPSVTSSTFLYKDIYDYVYDPLG